MADTMRSLRKQIRVLVTQVEAVRSAQQSADAYYETRLRERDATIAGLNRRLQERVNPLVERAFEAHSRSLEALSYTVRSIQNQL